MEQTRRDSAGGIWLFLLFACILARPIWAFPTT